MQKYARSDYIVIFALACYPTSRNEWGRISTSQAGRGGFRTSDQHSLYRRERSYDMDLNIYVHHTIELNGTVVWAFVLLLAVLVAVGALYTVLPLYAVQLPEQPKEPFGFQQR